MTPSSRHVAPRRHPCAPAIFNPCPRASASGPSAFASATARYLGVASGRARAVRAVAMATMTAAAVLVAGVGPASAASLREAVSVAVASHPSVESARSGLRAAHQTVREARSGFLPSVDVNGDAGWEYTDDPSTRARPGKEDGTSLLRRRVEGVVTQNVFAGYETSNRTKAARQRVSAAGHAVADRGEAIGLRAAEAFFDVVRTRRIVELARENVAAHMQVRDDVRMRLESGNGDNADMSQAESRLALARSRLNDAQRDLRSSESDYLEVVGSMPGTLEVPPALNGAVPGSVDQVVPVALGNNPALLSVSDEARASGHDKDATRAPFLPTVDVEVKGAYGEDLDGIKGDDTSASALLVVRYNLYRGGADQARSRRAVQEESQARQQQVELARLVEEQVRMDYHDLEAARANLPILQGRAQSSASVVSSYTQQFELGRRTLLDVLDVKNELFLARVSVVNAEVALQMAQYRVLATMGRLLPTLGLAAEGNGNGRQS